MQWIRKNYNEYRRKPIVVQETQRTHGLKSFLAYYSRSTLFHVGFLHTSIVSNLGNVC